MIGKDHTKLIPNAKIKYQYSKSVSGLTDRRMPDIDLTLHSPCRHKMGIGNVAQWKSI